MECCSFPCLVSGVVPPAGLRWDAADFFRGKNVGSRTSIAGLSSYVPPLVDLPQRAASYLEQHQIIYLLQEVLEIMLIRYRFGP